MKYNEQSIWTLFDKSLQEAKAKLSQVRVFCGEEPRFQGLGGWICEQTILYCILEEMRLLGVKPDFKEQESLHGRAKVDIKIGKAYVEIKSAGLFDLASCERYRRYSAIAKDKGFEYLFVTRGETHEAYRKGIVSAVGAKNFFDLEQSGEWRRFIKTLVHLSKTRNGKIP